MKQGPTAARTFFLVMQSDPQSEDFDGIPLAWLPDDASPNWEAEAEGWMNSRESTLEALVGASWLLATPKREQALARLDALAGDADPRVAALAMAQSWRGRGASADETRLAAWRETLDATPKRLSAGGSFVLGQELARRKRHDEAALLLLRVPILYPYPRRLAARCLNTAGQALEDSGKAEEAVELYREVLTRYADLSDAQSEASARLNALQAGR